MTTRKLTLIFDLDSIIINLLDPWLAYYNKSHKESVTIHDLKTWEVENHVKHPSKVYEFFHDVERYAACEPLPGASASLYKIHELGHDVVIATATAGKTANKKWDLVRKAAPWLNPDNVMVGKRKELLKCDAFVDDSPDNIKKYRLAWPDTKILTISYPYNQKSKPVVDCFAEDHTDTVKAWNTMVNFIVNLSQSIR